MLAKIRFDEDGLHVTSWTSETVSGLYYEDLRFGERHTFGTDWNLGSDHPDLEKLGRMLE